MYHITPNQTKGKGLNRGVHEEGVRSQACSISMVPFQNTVFLVNPNASL